MLRVAEDVVVVAAGGSGRPAGAGAASHEGGAFALQLVPAFRRVDNWKVPSRLNRGPVAV